MSKLTYEDKINIYQERKQGVSIGSLSIKYDVRKNVINYLISLIDRHGFEILRTSKNKVHTIYEKQEAIDRVLINGEAVWAVALDLGLLSCGMLNRWISKYKENGYNVVERKRGRPTMLKKTNNHKNKGIKEDELTRLRKENEYLKAELEYSKKLRAVVQARKNQQQKKK